MQDVKDGEGGGSTCRPSPRAGSHPRPNRGEVGIALLVDAHDLTVQDRSPTAQMLGEYGERWEGASAVSTAASTPVNTQLSSAAVELQLDRPAVSRRRQVRHSMRAWAARIEAGAP